MRSKVLLVIELIVVAAVFYLDWIGILPVSKTPYLFLLGWISLRIRGLRWRDVGLRFNLEGRAPSRPISSDGTEAVPPGPARKRAFAVFVTRPDFDQPIRKFVRDFFEMHELPGAGRAFDFEIIAVVMMKLLERFDQEVIDREPNRTAPV